MSELLHSFFNSGKRFDYLLFTSEWMTLSLVCFSESTRKRHSEQPYTDKDRKNKAGYIPIR